MVILDNALFTEILYSIFFHLIVPIEIKHTYIDVYTHLPTQLFMPGSVHQIFFGDGWNCNIRQSLKEYTCI